MPAADLTPARYVSALPGGQREPMAALRKAIGENLPAGFAETMANGMIAYVVPLSTYPAGYHASPGSPLPFVSLAARKGYIALYHMGLYGDPGLLEWFRAEYPKRSSAKLDMGKGCVRFRKPEAIPLDLIAELARKLGPEEWVRRYEAALKRA